MVLLKLVKAFCLIGQHVFKKRLDEFAGVSKPILFRPYLSFQVLLFFLLFANNPLH